MANTIQIRRGTESNLPTLNQAEFGYCTDSDKVYIGDGSANHQLLQELVQDTSPKLGGNLDADGNAITNQSTNWSDFNNLDLSNVLNKVQLTKDGSEDLTGNLTPDSAGTHQIGESGTQFSAVYADTIYGTTYYQDIVFEEKKCEICGEKFQPDDVISLIVTQVVDENSEKDGTYMVPIHSKCVGDA